MSKAHDYGEPWIANLDEWKSPITNESGEPIIDNCEIGEQELVRIVKCVNACAGIHDPAAAINAAKVALAFYASCAATGALHVAGGDIAENALNLLTPAP